MPEPVCRVCLNGDIKMHNIRNNHLQDLYEKLTSSKLYVDDGRPSTVCYICYAQLQKCLQFYNRALKSERILQGLLRDGTEVSHKNITVHNLAFTFNLSTTPVRFYNTLKSEDPFENWYEVSHSAVHDSNLESIKEAITVKVERDSSYEQVEVVLKQENPSSKENTKEVSNNTKKQSSVKWIKKTICSRNKTELFSCNVCNKEFKQQRNLEVHKRLHTKNMFVCLLCNKTFLLNSYLRNHMERHEKRAREKKERILNNITTEEKPYNCNHCNKKFKISSNLKAHLRTHSTDQPYLCVTCGKKFNQPANLVLHQKIHIGIKSFACELCGKAFIYKCNHKSHYLTHSGTKPYSCHHCDMTFSHKCSLKEHIRRLHTEEKPYSCSKCGKSFDRDNSLTKHLKSHTTEKTYACDKCNKSYVKEETLRHHKEIYSAKTPMACDTCKKTFLLRKYLNQHKKRCKNRTS